MPTQINEVVEFLRRIALRQEEAELTDGQLLGRFIERQDLVAATALVQRHGPMVWGVCRRILPNHQDAEDAFQATFLVLVRKAASVRQVEMVANWLYGVAHQTAVKARAMLGKRRARERQVSTLPETEVPQRAEPWRDLQWCLDEELSRLPDKYRVAIVLCDLEGKTRKEASRQLGLPEGTLAGRLARGRAMLAKRLAFRGLAVSAGALAAMVSQKAASACVPPLVMTSTIRSLTSVAAGKAACSAVISTKVAFLTEGVLKTMFLTQLKGLTAVLFLIAVFGIGFGWLGAHQLMHGTQATNPTETAKNGQKEARPKEPDVVQDKVVIEAHLGPNQGGEDRSPLLARWKERLVVKPKVEQQIFCVAVSPDGNTVASGEANGLRLVDAKTGQDKATMRLPVPQYQPEISVAFSPNGQFLATGHLGGYLALWDVSSAKVKAQFKGHSGSVGSVAFSPDGKMLVSAAETIRLWEVQSAKEVHQFKSDAKRGIWALAFSPDGRRLALTEERDVRVLEVATGKTLLTLKGHVELVLAVAYSLDGKRIASGSGDGTLRIWDAETGKLQRGIVCPTAGGNSLAFSPDGKILASGGGHRNRDVWLNDPTGSVLADGFLTLTGHNKEVRALAFASDGSFLATVGDDALRLWAPDEKGQKEIPDQKDSLRFDRDKH